MPDIALCQDSSCPSRMKCYRFTASPSKWQSYMDFHRTENKCDWFIEAISKSQVRRLDSQTEEG